MTSKRAVPTLDGVSERFYFRQFLSGRDFAQDDPIAAQMVNFAYAIGDRDTGEAMLVDPAYAAGQLLDLVGQDGLLVVGVLATHHHPDHVGGSMMGFNLAGVAELLADHPVPIHVNRHEADWVTKVTGISKTDMVEHDHSDVVSIGAVDVHLLHTPGHTPGSQCFLVDGRLVAGDTLFLQGCGRTDFPGGSVDDLYASLQQLKALEGDPIVHPGHLYAPAASAPLSEVTSSNYVYRASDLDQFRSMFG